MQRHPSAFSKSHIKVQVRFMMENISVKADRWAKVLCAHITIVKIPKAYRLILKVDIDNLVQTLLNNLNKNKVFSRLYIETKLLGGTCDDNISITIIKEDKLCLQMKEMFWSYSLGLVKVID